MHCVYCIVRAEFAFNDPNEHRIMIVCVCVCVDGDYLQPPFMFIMRKLLRIQFDLI